VSGVSVITTTDRAYITFLDEAGGGVTYVGKAAPRSLTASPVWQIRRITSTDTSVEVEFADGDDRFDNVWGNREALAYS
jgi:hypothetical protein